MRILLFTSSFLPKIGGIQLAVHNLAEGLTELDHEVLVAALPSSKDYEFKHKYRLERIKRPPGFGRIGLSEWWYKKKLTGLIRSWRPEIVHVHNIWPAGVWAAQILKDRKPLVFTAHGEDIQRYPEIPYGFRLDPAKKRKIDNAILAADALVSISEDIKKEYLEIGFSKDRIWEIPNGIDYGELSKPLEKAKRYLNIPPEASVVLAVGRNHPKKGFPDLLNIIAQLRDKIPNVIGTIVGRESSALQPLIEDLGIQKNIRLYEEATPVGIRPKEEGIPPEKQITTFFKAADVYAMPSLVESFGIVTAEAMAAGLPVVAMRSPGTVDLVKDNKNGFLVESGNISQFTEKLVALITDKSQREEMSKTAMNSASKYDRRVIGQKHIELYVELLDRYEKNENSKTGR